jgi:hypothetical protein
LLATMTRKKPDATGLDTPLGQTLKDMAKVFGNGTEITAVKMFGDSTSKGYVVRGESNYDERDNFEIRDEHTVYYQGRFVRIYDVYVSTFAEHEKIQAMAKICSSCKLVMDRINANGIAYLPSSLLFHVRTMFRREGQHEVR